MIQWLYSSIFLHCERFVDNSASGLSEKKKLSMKIDRPISIKDSLRRVEIDSSRCHNTKIQRKASCRLSIQGHRWKNPRILEIGSDRDETRRRWNLESNYYISRIWIDKRRTILFISLKRRNGNSRNRWKIVNKRLEGGRRGD